MEQNTRMIRTIYSLSDIKRTPSQVQYQILRFLSGYTPDYQFEWKLPQNMREHTHYLDCYTDHPDFYKNEITFLPYASLESIQDVINNNTRWKLARKHGLQVRVEETHDEMFKNKQATCKYIIIIACSNWITLRKAIKKDLYHQWESEYKARNQMYIL